ncbi:MAG: helix-turn-helix domain-containing protein [Hyphomonas sp.]
MARRHDWRRVRKHRLYTTEEAARALGVCKESVRRWMDRGLPAVRDAKPFLIRGADLITFLRKRRAPKVRCGLGEAYCVGCRKASRTMPGSGSVQRDARGKPFLKGHCETCGALMRRPLKSSAIEATEAALSESLPQADGHLSTSGFPRPSVH